MHSFVVILSGSLESWIVCTLHLKIEFRSCTQGSQWTISWPLINNFNNTKAIIFPMQAMLPFFSDNYNTLNMLYKTCTSFNHCDDCLFSVSAHRSPSDWATGNKRRFDCSTRTREIWNILHFYWIYRWTNKGELNLISVPPLYLNDNIIIHSSVHNRVTVARFDANNHGTKITFHSITCDDQGSYTWAAIYYDGGVKTMTARLLITITGII